MFCVIHFQRERPVRSRKVGRGFSPDFSVWDPDAYPTVLNAQRQGRVFYIQGPGSPVIEGMQITGGDGSAGGGDWGGGIFAVGGSGPSLTLTLRYNQVISNYATADLGTGGGLAAVFSHVILEDNLCPQRSGGRWWGCTVRAVERRPTKQHLS
jgi:hypothetical protein